MEKIKILFVCLGNICRSPMAEFVFKDIIEKNGVADSFLVSSAATSSEEAGNPVHYGTRNILAEKGIPLCEHYATKITKSDYEKYDYIIGMDKSNINNMVRFFGGDKAGKIHLLLDFANDHRDVADPWYTGDFETTYRDISKGCNALFESLKNKQCFIKD